jgi:Domain of unknown function (DUF4178)
VDGLGEWGQLGEDDLVGIEGTARAVKGWIAYDDEWVEYLLDDGRWLCVEDDGGLRFSLWEDQDTSWVPPDSLEMTYAGTTYRRVERYRARWLAAGVEGLTGPGEVEVWEYEGAGDRLAAVEDWGDGPEVSLGRVLPGQAVTR